MGAPYGNRNAAGPHKRRKGLSQSEFVDIIANPRLLWKYQAKVSLGNGKMSKITKPSDNYRKTTKQIKAAKKRLMTIFTKTKNSKLRGEVHVFTGKSRERSRIMKYVNSRENQRALKKLKK